MLQDEFLAAYGQPDVGGSALCSQSIFFPPPYFCRGSKRVRRTSV